MRRTSALTALTILAGLAAAPAAAQGSGGSQPLPRVIYGTPEPSVVYGPGSRPPEPAPPRPTEPAPARPPAPPQGSLTYQSGPAYLPPPGYWAVPPWDRPHRPMRPPAESSVPAARGGYYEAPQPPGRYVGRPPATSLEPRGGYERPPR